MSSIEKLSIQGVRSFSPNSVEEIKFQTPLTLIVGTNGSGKTTIIECLKYATTGDMPPITKSNGFLTDPQFYNITTVNAMVKLHFKNINNKLVITRNSSLSVDPTSATKKSTFKTLTKTLEDYNIKTNTKVTHEPSKTIAIEDILNKYIGVSKPILDYVIFAHQEDSLWPLSDSNTLKKRFDEIFEVSRFTKELQNLNAIKKNIKVDIKLREGDLKNCKENLKKFHVIQDRINNLNKTLVLYDTERAHLETQLRDIADAQQNLMNINQSYVDIVNEFTQLNNTKDTILKQLHLMSNMNPRIELRESKAILQNELHIIEENMSSINNNINTKYMNDLNELNNDLDSCNSKIVEYSTKLGALNQSQEKYEKNKEELDKLLKELDFMNEINKDEIKSIINQKQKDINNYLIKIKADVDNLKHVINQYDTDIDKLGYENKHVGMQNSGLKSEIKVLQSKLDSIERDHLYKKDSNRKSVEEENNYIIQEIDTLLNTELSQENIQSKEESLNSKISLVKELDENLDAIRKEILTAKQGSERSNVFHYRKNDLVKNLQDISISKFIESSVAYNNNEMIVDINKIKQSVQLDTVIKIEEKYHGLEAVQDKYLNLLKVKHEDEKKLESNLEALRESLKQKNTELKLNDITLNNKEKIIQDLQSSMSIFEDTLKNKLDLTADDAKLNEQFEGNLQILKDNLDDINDSIGMNTGMIQVFKHAKKSMLKKRCCNICKTSFENDEEKFNVALDYVNKKINTDVNELMKEKELAQQDYESYLNLRGVVSKFCDSRQKLVDETRSIESIITSKNASNSEIGDLVNTIKQEEESIKKAGNEITCLKKFCEYITGVISQLKKLAKLKRDLDETHQNENPDINSLASKQDELNQQRNILNTEVSDLTNEISRLKELKVNKVFKKSQYEAEIVRFKELFNEATNLKQQLQSKSKILQDNDELLKSNIKKIQEIEGLNKEKKSQLNHMEMENNKLMKAKEEELHHLKGKASRLFDYLIPEIKKFEDEEQHSLSSYTLKLNEAKNETRTIKNNTIQIKLLIDEGKKKIEELAQERETINQALEYLALKDKYIEVCDKLSNINEQEVLEYQREYSSIAQELNMAFTDLSSEISSKKGEIKQIKNQIETDMKTMNIDYSDIEQKYHEINCNSKTLLNMEHDLDVASKIIEMSIMNFHSKKMEEINVLLDELWRTTYKGSDIATIKIVTEKVKKNSASSGSSVESFNYKVVMFKDSLEIDMRGRCSAGQKVMACILIRLALAETFGVSCGVITLDEPTTNLDQENSEGLAESLHRIIESRRFQQNFQLVIITHDENFLKFMNAQDFTDGFWKVSKDNNLASKIEWKSIENLL
ncbi:uncharacterized protein HGUI_01200 [Hanseniaspora guilliermondii]|uniref:DNA repair protein RAD50 n=1 Tax=Hanseniaspora guilliermondii TaxID=56406 RepID=A0A1L0AY43_9ASCO|nr:uncharacterized protein HGUI_01200 [Hanseniaspora guilliermondii]